MKNNFGPIPIEKDLYREDNIYMRRRRRRRINPVIIVGLLIAAVAVIGIVTTLIMRRIPTKKQMDLTEYYGQTGESEAVIIIGTQILEEKAAMSGEQPYLPVDVVDSYLNQRYYWDEEGQQILYATPSELVSVPASSEAGGDVWLKDGTAYLSLDFVKRYTDLDTYVYQQPNRVAIQKDFSGISVVTANKDTYVRYRGGIKAEVLSKINKGDNLLFMEELENWVQVATWDGYIGYVEKKSVSDVQTVIMDRTFAGEDYTYLTMDQPVNLVWHQVMSTDANAGLSDSIQNMTGVNVISPTWFYVSDNSGNIINNATIDYVSTAHDRGLKVWGGGKCISKILYRHVSERIDFYRCCKCCHNCGPKAVYPALDHEDSKVHNGLLQAGKKRELGNLTQNPFVKVQFFTGKAKFRETDQGVYRNSDSGYELRKDRCTCGSCHAPAKAKNKEQIKYYIQDSRYCKKNQGDD